MQILEAFRALNALNEDVFSLDADGIKGLSDFKGEDDFEDDISIIDPEAETEGDLQANYIGKVILDCCVCHSKIYKAKEKVTVDESGELANIGEECPYCYTPDGFKIVGEVAAYNDGKDDEKPAEDSFDAGMKESFRRRSVPRKLRESANVPDLDKESYGDYIGLSDCVKDLVRGKPRGTIKFDVNDKFAAKYVPELLSRSYDTVQTGMSGGLYHVSYSDPVDGEALEEAKVAVTKKVKNADGTVTKTPVKAKPKTDNNSVKIATDAVKSAGSKEEQGDIIKKLLSNLPKEDLETAIKTIVSRVDDFGLTEENKETLKKKTGASDTVLAAADTFMSASQVILELYGYGFKAAGFIIDLLELTPFDELIPGWNVVAPLFGVIPEGQLLGSLGKGITDTIQSVAKSAKDKVIDLIPDKSDEGSKEEGLVGSAIGAAAGTMIGNKLSEDGFDDDEVNESLIGSAVGAAAGTMIGNKLSEDQDDDDVNEGLVGSAIGAAAGTMIGNKLSEDQEDEEFEEGLLGDVNVNLDARGFGGKDNNVSVLGGKMPMGEGIFGFGKKKKSSSAGDSKESDPRKGSRYVLVTCDSNGRPKTLDTSGWALDDRSWAEKLARDNVPYMRNGEKQQVMTVAEAEKAFHKDLTSLIRESVDTSVNEGIFGKKNSAEMNNARRDYERKVKDISGTSLDQIAFDLVKKIREATSEYKVGFDDANSDTDRGSRTRILTAKSKQIIAGYEELIKTFKKPNNFSQSASAISRFVRKILEDYASDTSRILDELMEYSNALIQVGKIDADKKLVKEQFNQFYKSLVYNLQTELDNIKKKPLHTLFREGYSRNRPYSFKESIDDLSMTANDTHIEVGEDESGKVTVTMEPVTSDGGEMIAPISDETETELMGGEDMSIEDEEATTDDEAIDMPVDEVDEESIDGLGESFLRRVYRNVESFKTSSVKQRGNSLIVEGAIRFTTGNTKRTSFIFEALDATRSGKVRFIGKNRQLAEGKNAFTLTGRMRGNKLIAESLNYNYTHKDENGKLSRVYGTERASRRR